MNFFLTNAYTTLNHLAQDTLHGAFHCLLHTKIRQKWGESLLM
jgi:hypothetical protein